MITDDQIVLLNQALRRKDPLHLLYHGHLVRVTSIGLQDVWFTPPVGDVDMAHLKEVRAGQFLMVRPALP